MGSEMCIRDSGEEIENPISIIKEQSGETVHFLDMEIVQSKPGVSQIRMYDKRDHMETLAEYRRYPHVETRLSQSCIYDTLHCQLCRFATRCTDILYFQIAAAKLIKDMIKNKYVKEKLRNTLPYIFSKCILRKVTDHRKHQGRKQAPCPRSVLVQGREGTLGSHQQMIYFSERKL